MEGRAMSESILTRTYTPPVLDSFDPYTAGMTGNLPAFFSYPTTAPVVSPTAEALSLPYTPPAADGADYGVATNTVAPTDGVRSFGEAPYGRAAGIAGTALGLMGAPFGVGLGLSALGTLADVAALRSDLETLGLPPDIDYGSALASDLSRGVFGQSAPAQFGQRAGYDIFAEAPLSSFAANTPTPEAFGRDMGAPKSDANMTATYDTPSYDLGLDVADGYDGGFGATDSSADGGYGGESQFKAGGLVPLAGGGKIAIGPGGGLDDLIPTSINGRRAAALSDGEFVIPADVVSMMGDGSSNAGARRFYDLVRQIRDAKTGTTRQAGPLPTGEILKRTMAR
jgi:hypothetical protein